MKANLFTLFFIVFISAKSQSKYDFPVELPVYLSGSFAELRPNHFHSGIDIKTRGKTGYKIYSLEESSSLRTVFRGRKNTIRSVRSSNEPTGLNIT